MSDWWENIAGRMALLRWLEALVAIKDTGASSAPPTNKTEKSDTSFSEIIEKASRTYGIDAGVINAVIKHESSFNPRAVSKAGAIGLMQLMPGTARGLGVKDPFDANENIMAGTRYLRQKLDEFGGDIRLALAAYNAGSGAVRRHGGVPPYRETVAYVEKVMKSIDYRA